jgi:hypothetical protein
MAKRKKMRVDLAKLSKADLLDLAVTDALKFSKRPNCKLRMGVWVRHRSGEPCEACMAGAVIIQEMGLSTTKAYRLWGYPSELGKSKLGNALWEAMYLIDRMRCGGIEVCGVKAGRLIRKHFRDDSETSTVRGRAPWNIYRQAARIMRAEQARGAG